MSNAIVVEILNTIMTLAPQIPEIVALSESAVTILQAGTVSPEVEEAIRAQLDAVKAQIDAA